MIKQDIEKAIISALKGKRKLDLKALRFILSQIKYAEIDKRNSLYDEEIVTLIQKEIKKRKEAVEIFRKGNRDELVKEEEEMIKIIEKYLPKQLSDEELEKIIKQIISSSKETHPGKIIGLVIKKVKGRSDGKRVSELVKKLTATG